MKVRFFDGVRVHIIIDDELVIYKSPRSCFQHFTRFPLLRRPLDVNVPFWVVWWASAYHRSPCSWLLLIQPSSEVLSDFQIWFSRAFRCNRGKHLRIPYAASRDQIHHSSLILLWLFLHLHLLVFFSTSLQNTLQNWNGRCWTNTKDDSTHHVWHFPWSVCLRVGFWCQRIWFGFWVQVDSIE